jgi:CSLREA domain-containing protein
LSIFFKGEKKMKKYSLIQKQTARVFPVLFNIGMMLVLLIGSAAFPNDVRAASTITVNSTADATIPISGDGLCTLREAITNANNDNAATFGDCIAGSGNDTIVFASSLGTATITLTSTMPEILGGTMIDGDNRITLSGNDSVQVLYVTVTGSLTLQNISVTHGHAGSGGGLINDVGGTVNIFHSVFSYNSATNTGGGAVNGGTMTITHSTFSYNSATNDGGGIINGGTLTIANSTFANNTAKYGGAIYNNSGTATILNSTFSDNSATILGGGVTTQNGGGTNPTTTIRNTIFANSVAGGDCWNVSSGTLIGGNNIIETTTTCTSIATITSDPDLGSLTTSSPAYFPLNSGSPAIDAGDNAICNAAPVNKSSQNGATRPINGDAVVGAICDIGAYEFDPLPYKLFLPLLLR